MGLNYSTHFERRLPSTALSVADFKQGAVPGLLPGLWHPRSMQLEGGHGNTNDILCCKRYRNQERFSYLSSYLIVGVLARYIPGTGIVHEQSFAPFRLGVLARYRYSIECT